MHLFQDSQTRYTKWRFVNNLFYLHMPMWQLKAFDDSTSSSGNLHPFHQYLHQPVSQLHSPSGPPPALILEEKSVRVASHSQ